MAIGLTHDVNMRDKLGAGYVQLEAFTTDTEFEIVAELQDRLGKEATLLLLCARPEGVETAAIAILMRITERMLARRRELSEDC